MKCITKYSIHQFYFPVDGYTHYVQVDRSVDGGKTFWHCGEGKYFRSFQDAKVWKQEQEKLDAETESIMNPVIWDAMEKEEAK